MLKALTITLIGLLAAAALKQLMDGLNAAKARVAVKRPPVDPRRVTRLRQDPSTGIYYPDA